MGTRSSALDGTSTRSSSRAGGLIGTVQEVYGPSARRHVVVLLTPELSSAVVDEPSTVSVPLDAVEKVAPAA